MHEAAFPATLLLGMEGFFGLLFGVPLYLCFARRFGESPAATRAAIASSPSKAGAMLGLTLLFTLTGVFNIMATNVTSSMTRNVWKNFRLCLCGRRSDIVPLAGRRRPRGGGLSNPVVLCAFCVMLSGAMSRMRKFSARRLGTAGEGAGKRRRRREVAVGIWVHCK